MNLYIFSNKKIKMQIYKIVLFSAFMFILLNETYASYSQNSNPEDDLAAKVSHDSSSSGNTVTKIKKSSKSICNTITKNEYLSKTKTAANIIAEQTKKTLSSESVQKMKNRIAKVVNSTTNYVTKKNKNQEK
ncbi:uncharacterized protein LOC126895545 isoform X2 [Daktulosphaira vitifoliae]|uniref:uncharacterized protein LOC126895545 isoform X2 n=1 Tax=Daktulosphaira vitifoliae TaxID=58002 RepID=UPI0021AA9BBC|nr:uncharacterized protein LOC126895545 isoform X2 [Daktulosphaira vitifoliae]